MPGTAGEILVRTMGAATKLSESATTAGTRLVALIAGEGKLPAILAKSAKEKGCRVVSCALSPEAQARVVSYSDKVHLIAPGQLGRNLKILQEEGVREVVFVGKVPKVNLLRNLLKLDWIAIKELSKLPDFNDNTIQNCVGGLLEEAGIRVLTQREFLEDLFPNVGVLTERRPTAAEYVDIDFGCRTAREISRLDIGQTVVVKDQMILAIEAIEGTDEAIRRAVGLARGPVVVCKVSKPNQDQRFDVPTVGMNTLNSMLVAQGGGVLAVEAKETLVVEREEMVAFADQHGISIVAV